MQGDDDKLRTESEEIAPLGSADFAFLDTPTDEELTAPQAFRQLFQLANTPGHTVFGTPQTVGQPDATDNMEPTSTQATATQDHSDEGESLARTIYKTEVIQLTERNPSALIDAIERLCIIHEVEWLMEPVESAHVSDNEYRQVKAAVQSVIEKSLTEDVRGRLPRNIARQPPCQILEEMAKTLVNKSRARQTTLRQAVSKIKLRRGR